MGLVKSSLIFSLYAQVITTFLGFIGLIYKVRPRDEVLREILTLETVVQVIEFTFYFWFSYMYKKNVDKSDIAKYRYYDWVFTTPIMLFNTIIYFEYNNRLQNKSTSNSGIGCNDRPLTIQEFFDNNKNNIILIAIYNFIMLLVGYLQEIGVINIWTSSIIGFYFLYLTFEKIYIEYAVKSPTNLPIFWLMTCIWSLYGVAAMLPSNYKNFSYNILDIFSKNFYGLYIAYRIYENRIN